MDLARVCVKRASRDVEWRRTWGQLQEGAQGPRRVVPNTLLKQEQEQEQEQEQDWHLYVDQYV